MKMTDLIKLFLKEENGCWIFLLKTGVDGYPYFGGKPGYRYVYEMINGEIPADRCIRHICNNKNCLNPEHLVLGTQKENMQDISLNIKNKRILEGYMEEGKEDDYYSLRIKMEDDLVRKLKIKALEEELTIKEFIWKTIKKNIK